MRKKVISLFILFAILAVSTAAFAADQIKQVDQPHGIPSFLGYVQNRFIVVMKPGIGNLNMNMSKNNIVQVGDAEFDKVSERFAVTGLKRQFPGAEKSMLAGGSELARYYKVQFESGTLDEAMEAYRNNPMVEKVEPIGIHAMYATPSDNYYQYQWHLNQSSDHDIDAPEAWNIETGSTSTIVALLDSGTRYYHPDLGGANASVSNPGASRGNMWINTAELNGTSGVDDDGNGYVDDWIGYDFVSSTTNCWSGEDCSGQDNDPRDFNGHGTHTAGIFGMITNDGYGMCGVAGGWGNGSQAEYGNGVKIMPLRMGYSYNYYGTEYGVVLMDAAAEAFYYAADNGAKIASCSWGSSNTGGIGTAASYFINAGGIICVAAGNDGAETSADYLNGRGDCISVAATDENDDGASFTTYGTWVDISAPGNAIYSTYHDHTDPNTIYWAALSGTSMATPMVAGVCGLIWSHNPSWTAAQVKSQLYSSADNIDAYLSSKYIGKMGVGRINAYNAVNTGPAPPVANFSGTPTSGCAPLAVSFTDLSSNSPTSWSWTFGDGGTSTAENPSHTYTSAGTYTVSLTATNSAGSDSETKTGYITVNTVPTAYFSGAPTSGEVPLTVNFTNGSTGATSYSWTFGDGGTSTATNPSHTYTTAGTFTVTLTATNACGNDVYTRTNYITTTCTPPVAAFTGSPTSGDYPLTVDFTDQSTGAATYSWNFGDGGSSTAQNPSHTYTAAGTYTVTLTVTNSCGSDDEVKTDYITVTTPPCDPPVADFIGSPTSGDYNLLVSFTDLSTNTPTSWSWTFGDGGSSTLQNPTHTYTAAGTYTVSLTATNACGSDGETKTGYITVTEPSSDYATPPYSTGFESGSFDSYWFTQSSNSEGRILITTANGPRGTYHMTMDDNTNGGLYAQNEAWLRLNLAGKSDVDLTFWWKEFSDEDHTQDGVFFSDNGGSSFVKVYNLTGGSSTYQQIGLDLDALASANGLSLTSTFVVKFQQYDNYSIPTDGMAFDDISVISYDIPPVADFVGTPTSGAAPLTVNFTDQSMYNPTSWSWTFGDGGTSTAQNPVHVYSSPGVYTVSLTATNAFGNDTETKTGYITVSEPSEWTVITYDDFESGWGSYTDGGSDCALYTGGTRSHQGRNAADIQDNSGTASSFYHTVGYNVSGYSELEVDFWFYAYSMEANEDFWVQYYDGSTWRTVAILAQGVDFNNYVFYHVIVTISSVYYNFPTNARLRFMCDASGNADDVYIDEIEFRGMGGAAKQIVDEPLMPNDFSLSQNRPNPFNPVTDISFSLPATSNISLEVYNVLGQRVAILADGQYDAGVHTVTWDASNQASGIYFYRLQTDKYVASKKMLLLK